MNLAALKKFNILSFSKFIVIRNFSFNKCLNGKQINKEIKILQKLTGQRKSGSKKWYPNISEEVQPIKFDSNVAPKQDNKKSNLRRISVLNKLFMTYITDLMATGSISEFISGKGVHITRVKISTDFTHLHVLWTAKENSSEIASILNRNAGILRHELSQLRVVGEVPIIKFIRDKTNENLEIISELIKNIDLKEEVQIDECNSEKEVKLQDLAITHNVFGLNRQEIMNKIRSKLKKSSDAWETHKTKKNSQN